MNSPQVDGSIIVLGGTISLSIPLLESISLLIATGVGFLTLILLTLRVSRIAWNWRDWFNGKLKDK